MTCVSPPLVTSYYIHILTEQINKLALALITLLTPHNSDYRHDYLILYNFDINRVSVGMTNAQSFPCSGSCPYFQGSHQRAGHIYGRVGSHYDSHN